TEEPVHDLERLLHPIDLFRDRRPVHPDRRLVQRLARADPDVRAARVKPLERGQHLRDDRGVVARTGRRDGRAQRHARGRLADGPEPHPRVSGLARLPPRLEVVRAGDAVEARLLGLDGLLQEVVGWELLVCASEEVANVVHVIRVPEAETRESRPWTLMWW